MVGIGTYNCASTREQIPGGIVEIPTRWSGHDPYKKIEMLLWLVRVATWRWCSLCIIHCCSLRSRMQFPNRRSFMFLNLLVTRIRVCYSCLFGSLLLFIDSLHVLFWSVLDISHLISQHRSSGYNYLFKIRSYCKLKDLHAFSLYLKKNEILFSF